MGFAGYFWFGILLARLRNVCPLFVWALRAVLFRMFFALAAVNVLPFLWALRAIIWFGSFFALLLTSALFSRGLCARNSNFICYFISRCGLYFGLVYYSPCFLTFALVSCGLCGQFYLRMFFALLLTVCPFGGPCGLTFPLVCYSPCF